MTLDERQQRMCEESRWDFSDLRAIFLNCTLKRSPEASHTDGLIAPAKAILEANGVTVDVVRPVDHVVPPGVYPDMTEHGYDTDEWPPIQEKVEASNIVVITSPIWLGEKSSVCNLAIERLYGNSGRTNEKGQWLYVGQVGGALVTGNEDGGKHCSMSILYALSHIGFTIPPNADAYWVGEAGPGPSFMDEGSGGPQNDWTQRNVTFMTWNLMHTARMLKDAGGIPAHGNVRTGWEAGCRYDNPNPEHRA